MILLKETLEIRTESEEEAKNLMETCRTQASSGDYTIGKMGYVYKEKKSKGEIVDKAYVVTVVKVYGGVWD